jgi:hypothetical protein
VQEGHRQRDYQFHSSSKILVARRPLSPVTIATNSAVLTAKIADASQKVLGLLDIYSGSLTRYYARDWKTKNQQICESMGVEYRMVGPAAAVEEEPRASKEDIEKAVGMWTDSLLGSLSSQMGEELKNWTDNDKSSYYTAQLTWPAFNALILRAAYAAFPDLASEKPDLNEYQNDPAYLQFADDAYKSPYKILARNVEIWLPCQISFAFVVPTITGRQTQMASVSTFKQHLEALNAALWQAEPEQIKSWQGEGTPGSEQTLEILAKYAYSVFSDSLDFASAHNLPVLLDY